MNQSKIEPSIVIADDDSVTCLVLRTLLREHGCKVIGEAHNGKKRSSCAPAPALR